jgi:hypothetical protein
VISFTLLPLYSRGKSLPIGYEAMWTPEPVWTLRSTQSAKDSLKGMADGALGQFRGNSQETVTVTGETPNLRKK